MTSEAAQLGAGAVTFLGVLLGAVGAFRWATDRPGWGWWMLGAQATSVVFWVAAGKPWWAVFAGAGGVAAVMLESVGGRYNSGR